MLLEARQSHHLVVRVRNSAIICFAINCAAIGRTFKSGNFSAHIPMFYSRFGQFLSDHFRLWLALGSHTELRTDQPRDRLHRLLLVRSL